MIWDSIDENAHVDEDIHAADQTIYGSEGHSMKWYKGFDPVLVRGRYLGIPDIPLDVRYESFQRRLGKVLVKHG